MKGKAGMLGLIVGAVGVIYGDIGTSPLYALKGCFSISNLTPTPDNVMGMISIFIWTLFLVVSVKYVGFAMSVDNHGEGGILVLSSLCNKIKPALLGTAPLWLGVLGVGFFFGDSIVTPAISVLSALEGLKITTQITHNQIVLLSLIILTALFVAQRIGTAFIGKIFGPVMILWFVVIAFVGILGITKGPQILGAFNPYYAFRFFFINGWSGFLTLGGFILVVTGAEALYADMGHFSRRSIVYSWNLLVFPALTLNYLGQGGLLLSSPEAISNPFYLLLPPQWLNPMVVLATLATIIASQSVISGLFSLSRQAIMLNLLPRMTVRHTSGAHIGQIYVRAMNQILYVLTVITVLHFQTSDNLAGVYGMSVAGVMLITLFLVIYYALKVWKWSWLKIALSFAPLMFLDLLMFGANLSKLLDGALYMIGIALIVEGIIYVWVRGNKALRTQKMKEDLDLQEFLKETITTTPGRIPGTAVHMCRYPGAVPMSLIIELRHNKFLHERLVFFSVITMDVPRVEGENKIQIEELLPGCYCIQNHIGFMEEPNLNRIVQWAYKNDLLPADEYLSFVFSKGVPVSTTRSLLGKLWQNLYIFMVRNSLDAFAFYKIPNNQVIELGVRYILK